MTGAAWVFLGALTVVSGLLMVAVGGNADLAEQLRAARREVARLRGRSLRVVGPPAELTSLYGSACSCGHPVVLHGDLGCVAGGCCCSRDVLTAAVDADLVIVLTTAGVS